MNFLIDLTVMKLRIVNFTSSKYVIPLMAPHVLALFANAHRILQRFFDLPVQITKE